MSVLLSDIFNAGFSDWQDTVFVILLCIVIVMLIAITAFFIYEFFWGRKSEEKMAEKTKQQKDKIESKKVALERDREESEKDLREHQKKLEEKSKAAAEAEIEAQKAKEELERKEAEIKKMLESAEMTRQQLIDLQKKEKTHVPEDFAINAVTRKVLETSEFPMRKDIANWLIPEPKTKKFTVQDVDNYLKSKKGIDFSEGKGKSANNYKIDNRTFALLYDLGDNAIKLTIKCGRAYGECLKQQYGEFFADSKFPYGLLWFTIEMHVNCSLEFIKQLIDISYRISQLGY